MKSINIVKILESSGADMSDLREQRPDDRGKMSQFFQFDADVTILVESTATSLMEEVLRFPTYFQRKMFMVIANELKNPGEQAVLEGDKKHRGARVVRLASSTPNLVELLLTH